ncbi:hypothetical protein [Bacillus toyonensis]|nr:hypothetical protein [Bacillus toyonensis]HDR7512695.1 hypothetical protein [Bacillus toyonensis]
MSSISEKGIYFAKNEFYEVIKNVGGKWTDTKFRPLVALIRSSDHPDIYWAIPMGDYEHRDENAKKRIKSYLSRSDKDISSCYYHVGKTDKKSIFFISDVVPITLNYIERKYLVGPRDNQKQYIIKNKKLISELERKIGRIISFEKNYTETKGHPKFRQRLLDIHSYLLNELTGKVVVAETVEV